MKGTLMRLFFCLFFFFAQCVFAIYVTEPEASVYRTYWLPSFHKERLNYCNEDKSKCGKKIAHQYCNLLGYHHCDKFKKAAHLGLTHYISGKNSCQGWACSGFEWIKCAGKRTYQSPPPSAYTEALFASPHWHHFNLSYCFEKSKGCGKKAAHAFCRWQAFRKVKTFQKATLALASKHIGDSSLCFGRHCPSFEYIICQR